MIKQTKCWIATEGHIWMDYYDALPTRVRRRLRASEFNLCPACLVTIFLPRVKLARRTRSREHALMIAIEIMEREVRQSDRS